MDPSYQRLRAAARRIAASLPAPAFYRVFRRQVARSRRFFETDPVVHRLHRDILDIPGSTMGHGIGHATAVSVDAGCLALVEATPAPEASTTRLRLAQCAGLLHDICRSEHDHAAAGAAAAETLLAHYPFSREQVRSVCEAIRSHVAFQSLPPVSDQMSELIGNCLYDADKFRWGPDNFTHTVWDMLDEAAIAPLAFARRFDSGIHYVETISATFRTATGQRYGPEFIDLGLLIARELKPLIEAEIKAAGNL